MPVRLVVTFTAGAALSTFVISTISVGTVYKTHGVPITPCVAFMRLAEAFHLLEGSINNDLVPLHSFD